ncbi:MarR family winged helix-turn-helix transcriptional regulator [Thermus sp.]
MGLEEKTLALLERLSRAERALLTKRAYALGLSATQGQILLELRGRALTAGELAEALGLAPPTVTDALNALKAKGLLLEAQDPLDRRRRRLQCTPRGEEVALALLTFRKPLEAALGGVPDLEGLWEGLAHLARGLIAQGVMADTGLCLTCRYLRREEGYFCSLLGLPLAPRELRLACPDHVPL